jgi:hypothetical protein
MKTIKMQTYFQATVTAPHFYAFLCSEKQMPQYHVLCTRQLRSILDWNNERCIHKNSFKKNHAVLSILGMFSKHLF